MSYNREIMSRYKQQKQLRDKLYKAGKDAAKEGKGIQMYKNIKKGKALDKSMGKLAQDFVLPKRKTKKGYN